MRLTPPISAALIHLQLICQFMNYSQLHYSDIVFDGHSKNSCQCPEWRIQVPVECAERTNGGSLSAQSVAARKRRRKISEKTQELGKLIPGGNGMNTADMFQAAYKYVKFLKAQIEILQLMGSFKVNKSTSKDSDECSKGLEGLLASPTVQEKLYLEEKCLVPRDFAVSHKKSDWIH